MTLEIGLAAEQAEAVPDLPFDGHAGLGCWRRNGVGGLSIRAPGETGAGEESGQSRDSNRAHRGPEANTAL